MVHDFVEAGSTAVWIPKHTLTEFHRASFGSCDGHKHKPARGHHASVFVESNWHEVDVEDLCCAHTPPLFK